jgi:hypothetical protein
LTLSPVNPGAKNASLEPETDAIERTPPKRQTHPGAWNICE